MEDRRASDRVGRKPRSRLLPLPPGGLPPLSGAGGPQPRTLALPRRWWDRVWLYRRLHGADVVLQRKLLPPWELALLRRAARRLLFDFDDAVFLRDSYAPRGFTTPGVCAASPPWFGRPTPWSPATRFLPRTPPAGPDRPACPSCPPASIRPAIRRRGRDRRRRPARLGRFVQHAARPGSGAAHAGGTGPPRAGRPLEDHLRPLFAVRPAAGGRLSVDGGQRSGGNRRGGHGHQLDPRRRLEPRQVRPEGAAVHGRRPAGRGQPRRRPSEMVRHGETGFLAETTEQWVDAVGRLAHNPELDGGWAGPVGVCWKRSTRVAWRRELAVPARRAGSRRKAGGMIGC